MLLPPRARCDDDLALQQWLARGDRLPESPSGYVPALAALFQWPGVDLPVAALIRERLCADAGNDYWLCADPAYVQADPNGARMLACGNLEIDADEAGGLARELRPLFGDQGALLELTTPSRWHLRMAHGARPPQLTSAEQALGTDLIACLPQGSEGRRWRGLFNEAQVVLHQHPVNAARRCRGQMPVNAVWTWGGGELPMWMKTPLTRVYSDDVLAQAMATRSGIAASAAGDFDAGAPLSGDALLDLDDADPASAPWAPLLQTLRRGRCAELRLHFVDGSSWCLRRRHRWRFWRRTP